MIPSRGVDLTAATTADKVTHRVDAPGHMMDEEGPHRGTAADSGSAWSGAAGAQRRRSRGIVLKTASQSGEETPKPKR